MINFRIIARAFSQVLIIEGLFMLATAGVSWLFLEDAAGSFFYSALITIVTGILVFTPLRNEEKTYGTREGYIIITGVWIIFSLFGTLPYLFTGCVESFSDAFFESVSGYTTTGATIFPDVESLPRGILFWRSLTQWLGGIAIIMLSLYVFPLIKSINIQLPATEFTGITGSKIHPKAVEAARRLVAIYVLLTLFEIILLAFGKMTIFEAICHSFSTLSTGGFSTSNAGAVIFSTPYLKTVLTLFMFIAGLNPAIIYYAFKFNIRKITGNSEFILYACLVTGFSLVVTLVLLLDQGMAAGKSFQTAFLHVVSIVTTTGYYSEDFNQWGSFLLLIIFILMFTGGMAGSASGGIKMMRLMIISKNSRRETRKLVHPSAYLPVRVDRKSVPDHLINNLLIYFSLYFIMVCGGTLVLSFMDYDIITSFSTTASMLANLGPGIGTFGPFTDYSNLPEAGKWFLGGLMLIGRLEFLAVMVLFTRSFYKR